MGASLQIKGLAKHYGKAIAVHSISLDIVAGEFVSLLGASGSGKTTTLMMVAGFVAPDQGDILLEGRPITRLPPEQRGIGVVFQNYALFPHMTVLQNVSFPLKMRSVATAERNSRALSALDRVGLSGFAKRLPSQLSGGQQQRVALARALVFEPGLLLMDEPLGALDRSLREVMKTEIRRLHRQLGITIVYVTHDQEEALMLSDKIALMDGGRIVQIGSAGDLYERPANPFVAGFVGESSLIPGTIVRNTAGALSLLAAQGGPPMPAMETKLPEGSAAMILLRPEKLSVVPLALSSDGLTAMVEDIVYVGDISRIKTRLENGHVVLVKQANRVGCYRPNRGDSVRVSWAKEDAVLLSADRSDTFGRTGDTQQ
jgi:putative spermidine/putrescine transport system ATP-binding protein